MRIFGLLGLVAALVIVGLLVKQQLGASRASVPSLQPPAASTGTDAPATVRDQSRQIQQQYKEALDAAMKAQPRDVPDEAK
ncbi:MAG: hypothetical protein Q4G70_13530 [Pseudomonadota bacterium]|nr:hypothetical protein [Pseudomonadota bacterium]